jgi:hypothetical protein
MADSTEDPVLIHSCGAGNAKCACECSKGGPCGHVWDGEGVEEIYEDGGAMSSASCSRCGMLAISHSMWLF